MIIAIFVSAGLPNKCIHTSTVRFASPVHILFNHATLHVSRNAVLSICHWTTTPRRYRFYVIYPIPYRFPKSNNSALVGEPLEDVVWRYTVSALPFVYLPKGNVFHIKVVDHHLYHARRR